MRIQTLLAITVGVVTLLPVVPLSAQQVMPPEQRLIVPPPVTGDVQSSSKVSAELDGTILQVNCEQTFRNQGSALREVQVLLPIPPQAVVTNGLLLADGREYPAEVLAADEARRIYESIVRARRDPALLELVGHGLIRLSAFPIPPGGTRTVSYRLQQSVATPDGRIRLRFPVAALVGLDRQGPLSFTLDIDGREPLVQVYSPNQDLDVDRRGPRSASVRWGADVANPHEVLELIVQRDRRAIGVDLRTATGYSENDYFLLAVSPGWELLQARERAPETVVFVLDTSGSMAGEKFEQAREAVRRLVENLGPRDRFNVIAFENSVHPLFRDGARRAGPTARAAAREWLDRLSTGGGTAIADALASALRPEEAATLVLFLTDGRATVGETAHEAILQRVIGLERDVRIYPLGVGYDVDATLLDDLARRSHATPVYVRPQENIEEAVTTLHRRVAHPCARNVRLRIRGARIHDLFPAEARDLFAGEPLLYAGRVRAGAGTAVVELTAEAADGTPLTERWRVNFDDRGLENAAVPVLWASRKAAALIDRIRRSGRDPGTVEELRLLSKRYGILNEEVALLAREDDLTAQAPQIERRGDASRVTERQQIGRGKASDPRAPMLKSLPGETFREAIAIKPGIVAQNDQLHVRGSRGGEVKYQTDGSSVTGPVIGGLDVSAAATASRLREAKTSEGVRTDSAPDASVKLAGGVTFHRDGNVWIDERLRRGAPDGVHTVRIRAYGTAYFELARAGGRLADWLALGERVRILLPGLVLEVTPDGSESLSAGEIARIRAAAARN